MHQTVNNLPAMQEMWVQSLGWEDSPGEGNGHPLQYSCLEPWTEKPVRLQSIGQEEPDTTEQLTLSLCKI